MSGNAESRLGVDGVVLSRQECDVLTASARGAIVCEVASELGLSEPQVRATLRSVMCKLGARSKLEAVLIALRRGLLLVAGLGLEPTTFGL